MPSLGTLWSLILTRLFLRMRSSKVNMSVKYPLLGSKPLDRCLEEAEVSGNLNLSGRNLRNLACCDEYDISDVTEAGGLLPQCLSLVSRARNRKERHQAFVVSL